VIHRAHWYCWSQILGILSEGKDTGSEPRTDDEEDRGYEVPTDANDTDIGTQYSMEDSIESETDEEAQSLLVPRLERSGASPILQRPPVGIQCGAPLK
jgi:hypothetical protein